MLNNVPFPLESRILYRDSSCIAVNKLKGEASEGASGSIIDLGRELNSLLGTERGFPQAVNRLDVPVTGCALFALTKPALSFLNLTFKEKSGKLVKRLYFAIIEKPPAALPGYFNNGSAELTHWIDTDLKKNKSIAYNIEAPGRKKSSLRCRIIGEGKNYLFMTVELLSGRHHQIRAQLAAIGLHVKGDLKYGAKRSERDGGIRLHARSLIFPSPLNESENIFVTADPPQMDTLWEAFLSSL